MLYIYTIIIYRYRYRQPVAGVAFREEPHNNDNNNTATILCYYC